MSPIWMDSSTHEDCKIIEDAVGGAEVIINKFTIYNYFFYD